VALAGRPVGSENEVREESKSMENYEAEIRRRGEVKIEVIKETERIIDKNGIEEIKKGIKEEICKRIKNTTCEIVMEHIGEEWKEEKLIREEERRTGMEVTKEIEKRLEALELEKEEKDRRNNKIRVVSKWRKNEIEQEVKEFIKEDNFDKIFICLKNATMQSDIKERIIKNHDIVSFFFL